MTSFDDNTLRPFRDIPRPPPASDTVAPMLIVGGNVAPSFATLAELAREIRERVAPRRLELKASALAHPNAIGPGVNVYAIGRDGREWIGTAAGRGVTVEALAAAIAPQARAAA